MRVNSAALNKLVLLYFVVTSLKLLNTCALYKGKVESLTSAAVLVGTVKIFFDDRDFKIGHALSFRTVIQVDVPLFVSHDYPHNEAVIPS